MQLWPGERALALSSEPKGVAGDPNEEGQKLPQPSTL